MERQQIKKIVYNCRTCQEELVYSLTRNGQLVRAVPIAQLQEFVGAHYAHDLCAEILDYFFKDGDLDVLSLIEAAVNGPGSTIAG